MAVMQGSRHIQFHIMSAISCSVSHHLSDYLAACQLLCTFRPGKSQRSAHIPVGIVKTMYRTPTTHKYRHMLELKKALLTVLPIKITTLETVKQCPPRSPSHHQSLRCHHRAPDLLLPALQIAINHQYLKLPCCKQGGEMLV